MKDAARRISWRVDLGVFCALAVFFLLAYSLGAVVTPFIIAALFAYVLDPAVRALEARKLPRGAAVALITAAMLAALAGALLLAALVLTGEIRQLINRLPGYLETFKERYFPLLRDYLGLPRDAGLDALVSEARDKLAGLPVSSYTSAAWYLVEAFTGAVNFVMALVGVFLIPVLTAYMLLDFDKMRGFLRDALPEGYREDVLAKLREVEAVLRDFVKGQLAVALIMGVLYSAGLWAAGVDMPVLVGLCSGVGNLVPYLGTALGAGVSLVLVLLKYHDLLHPALVVAVFVVVETLAAYLISPKVVGERLGLHPVAVILSVVVFGHMLGFVGILIAVPTAAVLKVFVAAFIRGYKESRLYTGG